MDANRWHDSRGRLAHLLGADRLDGPGYPPGTFIVVKPTEIDTLARGDIITYQLHSGEPAVITHRVLSTTADAAGERLLITQGDNNDLPDPEPVREVQVRGKLLYAVPFVGFLANALGHSDRGMAVNIIAVLVIGWGVLTMVRGITSARRDKSASTTAERPPAKEPDSSAAEPAPTRSSAENGAEDRVDVPANPSVEGTVAR